MKKLFALSTKKQPILINRPKNVSKQLGNRLNSAIFMKEVSGSAYNCAFLSMESVCKGYHKNFTQPHRLSKITSLIKSY